MCRVIQFSELITRESILAVATYFYVAWAGILLAEIHNSVVDVSGYYICIRFPYSRWIRLPVVNHLKIGVRFS